jgi:hypothetical protein
MKPLAHVLADLAPGGDFSGRKEALAHIPRVSDVHIFRADGEVI